MSTVRYAAPVLLLAAALAACGDDASSECVEEGEAKVCLTLDGGVQITAEGLEPGSELTVSFADGPTHTVEADETGGSGAIGFLTAVAPDAAAADITGTDADGQGFSVNLSTR